jgi:hypothetical protein
VVQVNKTAFLAKAILGTYLLGGFPGSAMAVNASVDLQASSPKEETKEEKKEEKKELKEEKKKTKADEKLHASKDATSPSIATSAADPHSAPCISWVDHLVKPRVCLLCIHGLGLYSGS